MKEPAKSSYPRNILLPVGIVTLCIVFVVFFYNFSVDRVDKQLNISSNVKMPINTKAMFRIDTTVSVGVTELLKKKIYFKGDSLLNIDLSSGEVILEDLTLKSNKVDVPECRLESPEIKVLLNESYPSVGKMDLDKHVVDLGMDLLVQFENKIHNKPLQGIKIHLKIPLSGTIDKESGVVQLSGEATIPPDEFDVPLPISVQVIAITDPVTQPNVSKLLLENR